MATINQFLNSYKKLEAEIRIDNPESSVFEYENSLYDPERQEKIKVCRILRNYIQHHADGQRFIAVSDQMITFLEKEVFSIKAKTDLVKSHISKTAPITPKTSIRDAIAIISMSNVNNLAIVDKENHIVGAVNATLILKAYSKSKKSTSKIIEYVSTKDTKSLLSRMVFAKIDDRYEPYSGCEGFVTADGTAESNYVGTLI